jgi:hypothetical protein
MKKEACGSAHRARGSEHGTNRRPTTIPSLSSASALAAANLADCNVNASGRKTRREAGSQKRGMHAAQNDMSNPIPSCAMTGDSRTAANGTPGTCLHALQYRVGADGVIHKGGVRLGGNDNKARHDLAHSFHGNKKIMLQQDPGGGGVWGWACSIGKKT